MIIAIDGPSGAGKSSVSDLVAKKLGFAHLDTGAMFRSVAYMVLSKHYDVNNADDCANIAKNNKIYFELEKGNPKYKKVFISDIDVTDKIRNDETTKAVTPVCKHKNVRLALLEQQREICNNGNFLVDGRDIGTVVFPDADIKIFLTASAEERAKRRVLQNINEKVGSCNYEQVLSDINRRDFEDSNRKIAPLKHADDAFVIDSSSMNIDEVVEKIVKLAKAKM